MNPLTAYANSLWLADPVRLQQLTARVLSYQGCPTPKDMVKSRQRWNTLADDLMNQAILSRGIDDAIELKSDSSKAIRSVKGKVGVIPIYGPVDQRDSAELMKAGGTPLEWVSSVMDAMLNNSGIGAVVLRFDSPGGNVYGTQELSDKIFGARGVKPVYAIADSMAASAALWLASAASMFIATPGGDVGSHGVYVMHVDQSAAMEAEGVKVTMVSAGKYKTEFAPYSPLSEDAKMELQGRVDGIYDKFTSALKRNRDTTVENVRQNYGQGRVLSAEKALSVGMIDRILTFEELIGKLTGGDASGGAKASTMMMKMRQEQRERETAKYFGGKT